MDAGCVGSNIQIFLYPFWPKLGSDPVGASLRGIIIQFRLVFECFLLCLYGFSNAGASEWR